MGTLGAYLASRRGYIARRVLCICIFLRMLLFLFLPLFVYVTSVSVLPSVDFLVKWAHKGLTTRTVVIAPRGIIEETLMYIANYQK